MFSPDSRAGHRRAQTRRRLPDLTALSSMSRPTVVKSLVGLGLASSVAAAIAIPVQASPSQVELSNQTSALVARDRAEAVSTTTSRSAARSSVAAGRTALSAPAATESAAVSAGTAGVTAVAKPKPKPAPKPVPAPVRAAAPAKAKVKAPSKAKAVAKSTETKVARKSTSTTSSSSPRTSSSGSASMAYYDAGRAKGLGANASKVYSAIRSSFGITNIGGYRAGAGDHGSGKAVDVMVTGSRGDAVAQWAINNMGAYDITYVIWKQRIWLAGASGWRAMEDRGGVTANHYDHVHISVQ